MNTRGNFIAVERSNVNGRVRERGVAGRIEDGKIEIRRLGTGAAVESLMMRPRQKTLAGELEGLLRSRRFSRARRRARSSRRSKTRSKRRSKRSKTRSKRRSKRSKRRGKRSKTRSRRRTAGGRR